MITVSRSDSNNVLLRFDVPKKTTGSGSLIDKLHADITPMKPTEGWMDNIQTGYGLPTMHHL